MQRNRIWRVHSKKADFKAWAEGLGIDQVAARIIRNRDITSEQEAYRFLNGTLNDMYSPLLMKDMEKAVEITGQAILAGIKIRIIGDYDIDGISSIYILYKGLLKAGADVSYDIPDRVHDGYGISIEMIQKAHNEGIGLIITCDNGIAAVEQIEFAKKLGMWVIVTDHHEVQYEDTEEGRKYILPAADAILDTKQPDCEYPFKELCGAGVAYKFVSQFYDKNGLFYEDRDEFLQFAAIATVGDIVDLKDENRIIVKEGLKRIHATENIGLLALIDVNGIQKENITSYHIGFVLGPCMNASGRLDTAKKCVELFLESNTAKANAAAKELKELNDERKSYTNKAVEEGIEAVENSNIGNDSILVVYVEDINESVAGIAAGKLKERYYKPVLMLTDAETGVKGSARSIESCNIFEMLMECKDILTRFGGHSMAAGVSLEKDNIEELRKRLNENSNLTEAELTETIWIDVPMPIDYISEKLIRDLKVVEPFGKGNPKPVFADKNLGIYSIRKMGRNSEFCKMVLCNAKGCMIDAVLFDEADELIEAYNLKQKIACTYYPEVNEYNNQKKLQITITGYRIER